MNSFSKLTLLTCLGLFLCCKTHKLESNQQTTNVPAMDQENKLIVNTIEEGTGFSICNKNHIPLSDADVYINGTHVDFDTLFFQYRFPANVTEPYDLRIEHPIHGKLINKQCYFDSQIIYLLENSRFYYREGGVQVPVLHTPNEYYLYLHNQHIRTNEENEQIDTEIAELLSAYKCEIEYVTFDNKFFSNFFRKMTFDQKDVDLPSIYHLLESDDRVAFFGPLLRQPSKQAHEAFGLSRTVEIYFNQILSAEAILKTLREFGLESTDVLDEKQNTYTTASFKEIYGMNITPEMNRLNEHPTIRRADNQLFQIITN